MIYLLFIIPFIVGIWAQARISSAYSRWSKVPTRHGLTGQAAAAAILRQAGISGVQVVPVPGRLTDNYDPRNGKLGLSGPNYRGASLAAVGVAAHEAGHAIQHARGYAPLKFRAALIPVTTFASKLLPLVVLGGLFFGILGLVKLGVGVYLVLTVFQLMTLPVEFDASRRARAVLIETGILEPDEMPGVVKTLDAAGFTYVAAFIASLANLLFFFLLARDN